MGFIGYSYRVDSVFPTFRPQNRLFRGIHVYTCFYYNFSLLNLYYLLFILLMQLFYWTHLLHIPFWVLLILHGPHFWYWFIGPGTLFLLLEKLLRLRKRQSGKGKTFINQAILLPSRVTHLVCRKPGNFNFHPGDYVYVNIPAIASSEWHPFTISSPPELPGIAIPSRPFKGTNARTVTI